MSFQRLSQGVGVEGKSRAVVVQVEGRSTAAEKLLLPSLLCVLASRDKNWAEILHLQ